MRSLLVLLAACGNTAAAASPTAHPPEIAPIAAPDAAAWATGCFVYRDAAGRLVESDHARCALPRRPYSTFKLANALIALDAGVLEGAESQMTWDRSAVLDDPDWPEI